MSNKYQRWGKFDVEIRFLFNKPAIQFDFPVQQTSYLANQPVNTPIDRLVCKIKCLVKQLILICLSEKLIVMARPIYLTATARLTSTVANLANRLEYTILLPGSSFFLGKARSHVFSIYVFAHSIKCNQAQRLCRITDGNKEMKNDLIELGTENSRAGRRLDT